MSKIRVLSDHVANQIAAGEVVERPASVAKELVENSIDAGARRIEIDFEAGGRRLLRVTDDGEGMTRDDAVLAFERHATSKISSTEDLAEIRTLGFRGEALASIASVARVELLTQTEGEPTATRVMIEGGRMRDVQPAARPQGTTITVRDLFFNVPARRKFLRSEATESFHLTNLITHYALAHPEIAFVLTSNGRETLRAAPAADLRERAYQIFGAEFLTNLLEVGGGREQLAYVRGYISAPRERRTTRDAQYLFVNGRFVRDRLISRALSEGYRTVLPHGVYPAALLFLDVPLEEVDVNVHPAKTEVRFRRAAAVADTVRDAVRAALASGGYLRSAGASGEPVEGEASIFGESLQGDEDETGLVPERASISTIYQTSGDATAPSSASSQTARPSEEKTRRGTERTQPRQEAITFGTTPPPKDEIRRRDEQAGSLSSTEAVPEQAAQSAPFAPAERELKRPTVVMPQEQTRDQEASFKSSPGVRPAPPTLSLAHSAAVLPPPVSASGLVREAAAESLSAAIRPLGQLAESFIIATDGQGLLLIDQHAAHERILFDHYRALESRRPAESQHLLVPETFDLTPAQAATYDVIATDLETYGFELMRLSGRTVAIKAVPVDLPAGEARNILAEVLDTVDAEKRGTARETLRDRVAASLARRGAIKTNTPLAHEKMRWLIDRLLMTSSPTTCPHGRPVILRITTRDIEKGLHRT